ncbi:hypothetical protein [uncultured Shewanella sp.]|uniref:hypothetical protein n=1 Tax=uncultured Shewanella sp. TaxID=173975 RepID=UPI00261E5789|nr:hypothetical protein [uncultured Shewanella sp.]
MSNKLIALLISSLLLGCGSSDDPEIPTPEPEIPQPEEETPAPTTIEGIIIDSAVIGIGYRTETQTGVTDDEGRYKYIEGESVTFYIGDLTFPATPTSGVVTPFNIAASENIDDDQVVNIARLLQTLDQDGDTSNGITISDTATATAEPVDFNLASEAFAEDSAVKATIENGGQDTAVTSLVDTTDAVEHLSEQMALNNVQVGIVGTWNYAEDENDLLTLVFFNDGTYAHFEVDSDDSEEESGMEWGTYIRNSETNRVTASQIFDGNGDTGLTDFTDTVGAPLLFAEVIEEQLVLSIDEDANDTIDDSLNFDKQVNDNLVGTWLIKAIDDQLVDENDLLMLLFNADGTYIHAEVDQDDATEDSGMEWGTYSVDAESNQVTVSQTFDSNGDTGLSGFTGEGGPTFTMSAQGNTLLLRIDEDGDGNLDTQMSFQRN